MKQETIVLIKVKVLEKLMARRDELKRALEEIETELEELDILIERIEKTGAKSSCLSFSGLT